MGDSDKSEVKTAPGSKATAGSGLSMRLGQKGTSGSDKPRPGPVATPRRVVMQLGKSATVAKGPTSQPFAEPEVPSLSSGQGNKPGPKDSSIVLSVQSEPDSGPSAGPEAINLQPQRVDHPTPAVLADTVADTSRARIPVTAEKSNRPPPEADAAAGNVTVDQAASKPSAAVVMKVGGSMKPSPPPAPALGNDSVALKIDVDSTVGPKVDTRTATRGVVASPSAAPPVIASSQEASATPTTIVAPAVAASPAGAVPVAAIQTPWKGGVTAQSTPLPQTLPTTVAPRSVAAKSQAPVPAPRTPEGAAAAKAMVDAKKNEDKPDWLVLTRQEPESLHSLLEPEPEEIARLKQGFKQHRFMSQSVILEESGLSSQVRSAMLAVSMVIVTFIVWASFSTMDEIASTQGQVMPSSPAQQIQHLEGGIVREIFVVQGQVVKEGAMIVRLDKEAVLADLNQIAAKRASLQAQEIRIRAFLSDSQANFDIIPSPYQSFVLGQQRLLAAQRSALNGDRRVLEARMSKSQARIDNLMEQQKTSQAQKSSLLQQLTMKAQGVEKGLVSRLVYLDSQREYDRIVADEVRTQGELATARRELEEAMGELDGVIRKAREANLRELGSVTTDLAQAEEQGRRLQDRVDRTDVRSPVWGVVNNLQVETVGGVIAPGALIAEIIPMDSTRRVETRISPRDVGHVAIGQSVTVKVSTYDFARYGGINGILESVSPTTFKDPQEKEPFYKGIIRLDRPYVGMNERANPVLPGMTVQADIDTGSKTLMEYMLKPIYASINKAFRER
ncbi:MAG: HlyD family type I secretion periplasmic adaptor subunit [Magnetococcales bacterium]|nr:HlyD family type I secretion periplasmic adaptor subunit [Magnetococcales bacterium]